MEHMELLFSSKFPWGEPSLFLRKINNHPVAYSGSEMASKLNYEQAKVLTTEYKQRGIEIKAKVHTIRKDVGNEWCAGRDIEMIYTSHDADDFQFSHATVTRTQKIEIEYLVVRGYAVPCVFIDDKILKPEEINTLARNDGFCDAEQFFRYFNKPFEGKIIHWTNRIY